MKYPDKAVKARPCMTFQTLPMLAYELLNSRRV